MAKRPDSFETTVLAIELLRRLPRSYKVTARELRDQLEQADIKRDLRTIQRLLEMLSRQFGEIERDDRTKPYGYRWKEKSKGLALPVLSEQESLLLSLAEQHLCNLLPAKLMKSMEGIFSQARTRLSPHAGSKQERDWLSKVRVVSSTQPLLPPKIDPRVLEEVSNALYGNRWLALEYTNAAGKRTKADVMPLGLAQQGPRLYLVCRFRGYDNERSLAINRIQSASTSTLTFVPPPEFDLKRYDNEGRFGYGEGKRVRLRFWIQRDAGFHLLESPLSEDQTAEEVKGGYRITATVVDSGFLWKWLRGFGSDVKQIETEDVGATAPIKATRRRAA